AVLVRSGLSSVWSNQKCDPVFRRKDDNSVMSIYDFMTLPSYGDTKGTPIPLPTPDEVAATQDPVLAKKSKVSIKQNTSTSLDPFGPGQPSKKK
ncbi:hypothetical protein Tco_0302348, partial [Tanacetum coccineum]